jgi:ferredoxin-NADP reductase
MISPDYPIVLQERYKLSTNARELCYTREDGGRITYVPGQFFSLHFPYEGKEKARSYSVVNRISNIRENTEFRFAISAVPNGAASQYFFNASPGDAIKMGGPFGNLILPPSDPKRYLLIATGTGVSPYRSMMPILEQRMRENPKLQITLIMGTTSREELIYGDEFITAAEDYPGFNFYACYSREMPDRPKSCEHSGHVQELFDQITPDNNNDLVYLCGNPAMIDDSVRYFDAKHFAPSLVKQEKYKFSEF